jgi:hypothetical protein
VPIEGGFHQLQQRAPSAAGGRGCRCTAPAGGHGAMRMLFSSPLLFLLLPSICLLSLYVHTLALCCRFLVLYNKIMFISDARSILRKIENKKINS